MPEYVTRFENTERADAFVEWVRRTPTVDEAVAQSVEILEQEHRGETGWKVVSVRDADGAAVEFTAPKVHTAPAPEPVELTTFYPDPEQITDAPLTEAQLAGMVAAQPEPEPEQ